MIESDLKNICILDTETTGLNEGLTLDEPVEIAVTDGWGVLQFHSYVKPTVPVSVEARATHDIIDEILEGAPSMADILPDLVKAVDGRDVWVYNAKYDLRIIQNACVAHRQLPPYWNYQCAMQTYAEAFGLRKSDQPDQFRWWSLSTAYEQQFEKVFEDAHSAAGDCKATAALLHQMATGQMVTHEWASFRVIFTHLSIPFTSKREPYACFHTAGGQKVNVFQNRWPELTRSGFPIHEEMKMRLQGFQPGIPVKLDEAIGGAIAYKDGWPVLVEIGSGEWG